MHIIDWIFCGPCRIYYHALDKKTALKARRRKYKQRQPPKLSKLLDFSKAPMEKQVESSWFKLPAEIRNMIYEEVFWKGKDVHICYLLNTGIRAVDIDRSRRKIVPLKGGQVLQLLQTCRRMYAEAVPFLYSTPTFVFYNPVTFLLFNATVPESYFHLVVRVKLNFREYQAPWNDWPNAYNKPAWEAWDLRSGLPVLNGEMTYQYFKVSESKHFYNPVVLTSLSSRKHVYTRSQPRVPTFWQYLCQVLEKMQGLQDVEVRMQERDLKKREAGVFGALEHVKVAKLVVKVNRARIQDGRGRTEEITFRKSLRANDGVVEWEQINGEGKTGVML